RRVGAQPRVQGERLPGQSCSLLRTHREREAADEAQRFPSVRKDVITIPILLPGGIVERVEQFRARRSGGFSGRSAEIRDRQAFAWWLAQGELAFRRARGSRQLLDHAEGQTSRLLPFGDLFVGYLQGSRKGTAVHAGPFTGPAQHDR